MRKGRWIEGLILALRMCHRPILAGRAQHTLSALFLETAIFTAVGVAFGNATLDSSGA
jgi:hypothetical protein